MSVEAFESFEPVLPAAEETTELAEIIALPPPESTTVSAVAQELAAPDADQVAHNIAALRILSSMAPNGYPLVTDQPAGLLQALEYVN